MLVVLYDIQIPLYNKCVVIDRYITHSLIREVSHLDIAFTCWFKVIRVTSMFSGIFTANVTKTFGNLFGHAPRSACLFHRRSFLPVKIKTSGFGLLSLSADYLDFQITRCQIKGNFLYTYFLLTLLSWQITWHSKTTVFWYVTPCSLVHCYQHFGETSCLPLQDGIQNAAYSSKMVAPIY